MASDVDDVVHHHRDGARRGPQRHRPDAAAFWLVRGLGYVTPLLHIPAPHGPLGSQGGGAELGGGPMEHTGNGVRQKRSGDPGAQDGYDTQTDRYPAPGVFASGDLRPTLRKVIVATGLAGSPGGSAASATRWAYLNHVRLLNFPSHFSSPPQA
jgi:hypothetical protein